MAIFGIRFAIGLIDGSQKREVEGLVDADKMFAVMPTALLHEIGVAEQDREEFEVSPGEFQRRAIGFARLTIDNKAGPMLVVFGSDDTVPVLGKHSLMGVALEADPESQRLVPARLRMCDHPRLVSATPFVNRQR